MKYSKLLITAAAALPLIVAACNETKTGNSPSPSPTQGAWGPVNKGMSKKSTSSNNIYGIGKEFDGKIGAPYHYNFKEKECQLCLEIGENGVCKTFEITTEWSVEHKNSMHSNHKAVVVPKVAGYNMLTRSEMEELKKNGGMYYNLECVDFSKVAGAPSISVDQIGMMLPDDMSHSNLVGSNFEGVDLSNKDFSMSDLKGARLHGARIDHTDFRSADLRGASFRAGGNPEGEVEFWAKDKLDYRLFKKARDYRTSLCTELNVPCEEFNQTWFRNFDELLSKSSLSPDHKGRFKTKSRVEEQDFCSPDFIWYLDPWDKADVEKERAEEIQALNESNTGSLIFGFTTEAADSARDRYNDRVQKRLDCMSRYAPILDSETSARREDLARRQAEYEAQQKAIREQEAMKQRMLDQAMESSRNAENQALRAVERFRRDEQIRKDVQKYMEELERKSKGDVILSPSIAPETSESSTVAPTDSSIAPVGSSSSEIAPESSNSSSGIAPVDTTQGR